MARRAKRAKRTPSPIPAIGLLLAFGAAGGVLYNMLAPRGIFRPAPVESRPAGEVRAQPQVQTDVREGGEAQEVPQPVRPPAKPRIIEIEEAKRIVSEGSAVIVDARSAQTFALGHIPGAINIASDDFETFYAESRSLLPPSVRILVYCSSANCDESHIVLKGLAEKGHGRLLHYANGWNEWEFAGMPVEKGAPGKPER